MGKIAFLFPGQGSQKVGMGQEIAATYASAKNIFDQADETLGYALSELCFSGPEEELRLTTQTQPALLTTSIALLAALQEEIKLPPDYVAGHSLGEYSALVSAGALAFSDAVAVVRERGKLMEEALPAGVGSMAAILGLDRDVLTKICQNISNKDHVVELANLNCPGQIVISGHKEAVAEAGEQAKEAGARKVVSLAVSGPFHSSLMAPAADRLEQTLRTISIGKADVPVIANVSATAVQNPDEIFQALIHQVAQPVLWEDTIQTLSDQGVDQFIEIGSGKVLAGLVKKVNRKAKTWNVYDVQSLQKVLKAFQ